VNGPIARIREEMRQRRQHREFRIAEPVWDAAQQARLDHVIAELTAATTHADAEPPVTTTLEDKALADAATNLWSALGSLDKAEGRPPREVRRAGRYLRNVRDTLADAGLVIRDHTGEAFHPGRSLEVLAYVDEAGLERETVLETVRPSITLGDRRIQMGQVIVGCPAAVNDMGETRSA
jgi:hypothetical protein